jgi:hypothetical protein
MFSNQLSNQWKYKWFGFWGIEEKCEGKIYQIEDYVDSSCPTEVLTTIIIDLSQSPIVLVGQLPNTKCGLCDELVKSHSFCSDSVWLWTKSLSHYAERHNFCIPNAMVEHILSLGGVPPKESGVSVESLPWP